MAQITIKNPAGKDAGKVDLDEALFGVQPNVPLMHQVVTAQLARRRAGTQSTKLVPKSAAAAPSRTARRAPAMPARARRTRRITPVVVLPTGPSRARMRSARRRR